MSRTINVHSRATSRLIESVVSDQTTGDFSTQIPVDNYYVVVLDNTSVNGNYADYVIGMGTN